MSASEMTRMMEMNDAAALGKLLIDQLEWRQGDGANGAVVGILQPSVPCG